MMQRGQGGLGGLLDLLRPHMLARLSAPVNLTLIVLIAHELATLTWQLIPLAPDAQRGSPVDAADATAAEVVTVADYGAIADWHLFGELQAKPKPQVIKAPETRLDLRLAGLLYTEDKDAQPLALIAVGKEPERLYRPGDELDVNVRIEQIQRDKVILARNGRLEALSLPTESTASGTGGRQISLPHKNQSQPLQAAQPTTVKAAAIVERFREAVREEPGRLQELAFASPYVQHGEVIGFRLKPGRNRRLLGQLGLRGGDVLTQINGIALNSPAQGLVLLRELMQSDRIEATVLRDGAEVPFTFLLTE